MDRNFLWICSEFFGLRHEHGGVVGESYVYRLSGSESFYMGVEP